MIASESVEPGAVSKFTAKQPLALLTLWHTSSQAKISEHIVPSETGENGSASLLELAFFFLSSPVACIFNLSVGFQEFLSLGYGGV